MDETTTRETLVRTVRFSLQVLACRETDPLLPRTWVAGALKLTSCRWLPLAAAFAESRGLPVESNYSYRGLDII
jgi:hypothetical protein